MKCIAFFQLPPARSPFAVYREVITGTVSQASLLIDPNQQERSNIHISRTSVLQTILEEEQ